MRIDLAELPLLLGCLWCGSVLGIAYDLLRLPRLRGGRLITAICDFVFGALFFFLTAATLFYCDSGRLRAYSIPVILLAFLVWQLLPGRLLRLTAASAFGRIRDRKAPRGRQKT